VAVLTMIATTGEQAASSRSRQAGRVEHEDRQLAWRRRLGTLSSHLTPSRTVPAASSAPSSAPAVHPNLLVVITDDQGLWTLGCYGNDECKTPHLDGLASEGLLFRNFFCVSPVCSPARASMLTGRIPSQHGIHDWLAGGNTPAETDDSRLDEYLAGQSGYTDALAAAGYICGLSGKWHMGHSHKPQKGFSFWRPHTKGGGPYYDAPMVDTSSTEPAQYEESRYVTDAFTDTALEFLEERAAEPTTPWCCYVGYTAPHSPWGREHHPKHLWDKYHDSCPFESAPALGKQAAPWVRGLSIPVESEETRRAHLAGYYASIERMDHGVGRLLAWLDAHGQRENTLVVFTSEWATLHPQRRPARLPACRLPAFPVSLPTRPRFHQIIPDLLLDPLAQQWIQLRPPWRMGQGECHVPNEHVPPTPWSIIYYYIRHTLALFWTYSNNS
jgi:hypothetical protein